jgi:ABC-type dipeptide/oligopeptide/nickel transport system permease component
VSDPNGCIISQSFAVVSKTVASAQVAQYALFNTAYGAIQADFGCNAVRTVPAASAIHTLTADLLPKTVQVTTSGLVSAVLAGGSSGKCTWINSSSWLAVVPSGATAISSATGLSFL